MKMRPLRAALCLLAAVGVPGSLATAQTTVPASVTVISDGPKQTTSTETCSGGTCVRTVTIVYIN